MSVRAYQRQTKSGPETAVRNAEKFGAALGYVVRFDADAIKSMAITALINMSERPAR